MEGWDEAALHAVLPGASRLRLRSRVDSTNDEIRRLAESGAPSGTAVAAAAQGAGRGRLGRSWYSPPGAGLYLSVLHRTGRPVAELPRFSLGAAAAAWEACRDTCDADVRIKWPNDLLCGGRKFGGILVESWGGPGHLAMAVGVGINVSGARESFPGPLRGASTSLAAEAKSVAPSREALLAAFLPRFQEIARSLEGGDWEAVRVRWERGAGTMTGRRVAWAAGEGEPAEGQVEAMTESGTLVLRAADGGRHEAVLGESLRWLD